MGLGQWIVYLAPGRATGRGPLTGMSLDQWIVTGHRARSLAEAHPQPQSDHHFEVPSSALAVQLYKMQRHGVNSVSNKSVHTLQDSSQGIYPTQRGFRVCFHRNTIC